MDEDGVFIQAPQAPQQPQQNAGNSGTSSGGAPGNLPVQPQEPEPDSQAEEEESRIFDISSDLNISPATPSPAAPKTHNQPIATKSAPASPQPKKIGQAYGFMAEKEAQTMEAQAHRNLQEAVSTMIPEKLQSKAAPTPNIVKAPAFPSAPIPFNPNVLAGSIPLNQKPLSVPVAGPSNQNIPPVSAPLSAVPKSQPAMSAPSVQMKPPSPQTQPVPTPPIGPTTSPGVTKPALKIAPDPNIKPLRTYESDVADVMSHRNISRTSMAIAENEKKSGEDRIGVSAGIPADETPIANASDAIAESAEPRSHAGLKLFLAVFSLALIAAGIFGGYYLYQKSPLAAPVPQPTQTKPRSIVKSDSQTVIVIDGLSASAIASKIRAEMTKPQPPDTIEEVILAETENGTLVRASTTDAISDMGIPVPDIMARSLLPGWMLGIYSDASGTKSAFVVVETSFFQNAFAGMLQWEATMPQDLEVYLPQQGSSTVLRGRFEDRIVKNDDAREFVTTDGQAPFLYSFIDSTKLAVAGNEGALSEIITRLEQQAFIR